MFTKQTNKHKDELWSCTKLNLLSSTALFAIAIIVLIWHYFSSTFLRWRCISLWCVLVKLLFRVNCGFASRFNSYIMFKFVVVEGCISITYYDTEICGRYMDCMLVIKDFVSQVRDLPGDTQSIQKLRFTYCSTHHIYTGEKRYTDRL